MMCHWMKIALIQDMLLNICIFIYLCFSLYSAFSIHLFWCDWRVVLCLSHVLAVTIHLHTNLFLCVHAVNLILFTGGKRPSTDTLLRHELLLQYTSTWKELAVSIGTRTLHYPLHTVILTFAVQHNRNSVNTVKYVSHKTSILTHP